ncbi:MAG: SAM-dependent methyltransferase [Lachnospiraceae bacterium]|nr:SAM-dependent methyltransferase [Lachnospiraceae bacterium]
MEAQDREKLEELFQEFLSEALLQIFFSNSSDKEKMLKAKARPLLIGGKLVFQLEEFVGKQAFHKNLGKQEAVHAFTGLLENQFRQCELQSEQGWAQVLVSKKGKVTVKKSARTVKMGAAGEASTRRLVHNRQKSYVLEEGTPVPFLVDLGVMTKEGKVVRAKYDKFRQINRFLEFIEDILPQLSRERENTIIDFGCGKSYLTFAMYHYLKVVKGYAIRVIGLDLKQDVIDHCNQLSRKYHFDTLRFYHGDIASYEGVDHVDMVVTLHACDTATDYALAKAVNWGAQVILSVPCCQHEWNRQMQNEQMKLILQYGLLKERLAALYTDGLRAELLEHEGYRTQILEFIDMEHTPKNILIRAVKQGKKKENEKEIRELMAFWQVEPTLAKLLLRPES